MSGGSARARARAGLRWAGEVRNALYSHWRGWGEVSRMAGEFSVQGGWSAGQSPDEEQGRCSRLRRGLNSPAASQLCLKEAADSQTFSCYKGSHRSHLGSERRHGHPLPAAHPTPDSLYRLFLKCSSSPTLDTFLLLKKWAFPCSKAEMKKKKKKKTKKNDHSKLTV